MIDDDNHVVGYHTICPGSISPQIVPKRDRDSRLSPHRPTPVIILARFALDSGTQGQGIGTELLLDALRRAHEVADQIGGHAVCLDVDEENPEVKGFYLHHDFMELLDSPLHLYLPMKTIRELNLVAD